MKFGEASIVVDLDPGEFSRTVQKTPETYHVSGDRKCEMGQIY